MVAVGIVVVGVIILIYTIAAYRDSKLIQNEALHEEREALLEEINSLKAQKEGLIYNKVVQLPENINNVLDIYEQSGIYLPADIIEELQGKTFTNHTDIIEFIEIQRDRWKRECQKKLYRKGLN